MGIIIICDHAAMLMFVFRSVINQGIMTNAFANTEFRGLDGSRWTDFAFYGFFSHVYLSIQIYRKKKLLKLILIEMEVICSSNACKNIVVILLLLLLLYMHTQLSFNWIVLYYSSD